MSEKKFYPNLETKCSDDAGERRGKIDFDEDPKLKGRVTAKQIIEDMKMAEEKNKQNSDEVDYPNLHGVTDEYGELSENGNNETETNRKDGEDSLSINEAIKRLKKQIAEREENDDSNEYHSRPAIKCSDPLGKNRPKDSSGNFNEFDEIIINPDEENEQKNETTEDRKLVESYDVFQREFPGNYETVYYPCCARDISPSKSFSNSKVLYVDLDQKSIESLKKEDFEAYCDDAVEYSNNEKNKESADIVIIMNPRVSGLDLINNLKKDGYVLCNDYHHTATEFSESSDFELLGIIHQQDQETIFDKENPNEYWEEVDSEEDFKKAPVGFGQMNYNGAKEIVKRIKGEESKEVLNDYKKILEQEINRMNEEERGYVKETGAVMAKDTSGEQLLLITELPRKKGTCDDVFVFKKK